MVDIIIPAYNAHKTIIKTLASLALQIDIDIAKIYIINDCSNKDYKSIIDDFDNLCITEINLSKNVGPGMARQIGLDNSNSEYVMFMDSDDQFYNQYNFRELYENISMCNLDLVYGKELVNYFEVNNNPIANLHGKIYRRSYLVKNNIRFNNTRYSEDHSFNKIALYSTNKVKFINSIVYIYCDNKKSSTHTGNDLKIIMYYLFNMIYMTLEFKRRKINKNIIADNLVKGYVYTFYSVKTNPKLNNKKLFNNCYRMEELFLEYEKYITKDFFKRRLLDSFECNEYFYDTLLKDFNHFRNKFRRGRK